MQVQAWGKVQVQGVRQSTSASVRQRCKVRCVRWGVFCHPLLSVCTGDISTKAIMGVDVAVQVP